MTTTKNGVVILPSTMKAVKDVIDAIYEQTNGKEHHGGFKKLNSRSYLVQQILVNRGSLLRTGHNMKPVYTWNPVAMGPTKAFYESVAEEIVLKERAHVKASSERKKAANESKPEPGKITETFFDELQQTVDENPLPGTGEMPNGFELRTDEEIWNELKARGYVIEDGALVKHIIKRLD